MRATPLILSQMAPAAPAAPAGAPATADDGPAAATAAACLLRREVRG